MFLATLHKLISPLNLNDKNFTKLVKRIKTTEYKSKKMENIRKKFIKNYNKRNGKQFSNTIKTSPKKKMENLKNTKKNERSKPNKD